jgi:hypothetical protein
MWHAAYLVKQAIGKVPDTSASLAQFGRWRGGGTTKPVAGTAPMPAAKAVPSGMSPTLRNLLIGGGVATAGAYLLNRFGQSPDGAHLQNVNNPFVTPKKKPGLTPADDLAEKALEDRNQGMAKAISPGTSQ